MNSVVVISNAPVLIPNAEHKNFTETDKMLPVGTNLLGNFKKVEGLRRGEPFTFRLFIDKNGMIIYEKNVKKMEQEINLDDSPRVVNMPSVKGNARTHAIVSVVAGVITYAVAKKMKQTGGKALAYAGLGALAGYLVASQITKKSNITYQKK